MRGGEVGGERNTFFESYIPVIFKFFYVLKNVGENEDSVVIFLFLMKL